MERWETSDNPIVHKIQEYALITTPLWTLPLKMNLLIYVFGSLNEAVFNETDSGSTYKEIRRRDP